MLKKLLIPSISVFLLFSIVSPAFANIVTVNKDGSLTWDVLSDTSSLDVPKQSSIEITQIGTENTSNVSSVSLEKNDSGKISLLVSTGNEKRELDVTNVSDGVVQIEARPTVQKLTLGIKDGKFALVQNNVTASTEYPVNVDPKTAEISVTTPSGSKYISILPYQASEIVLRTKLLNKIATGDLKIVEDNQQLEYQVSGEKVFNFFDIYSYSVPVTANLLVSTGEIKSIDAPFWYKVVGFLIT